MLITKRNKTDSKKEYLVTDVEGNTETFTRVYDIAVALGCTTAHVYNAIKSGRMALGCSIREITKHDIVGVDC